jgi:hypothetical protein
MSTKKQVTKNDILSFVYHETQPEEKPAYLKKLSEDIDLNDFFGEVVDLMSELDKIELEPSTKSVKNILKYSRNFSERERVFAS